MKFLSCFFILVSHCFCETNLKFLTINNHAIRVAGVVDNENVFKDFIFYLNKDNSFDEKANLMSKSLTELNNFINSISGRNFLKIDSSIPKYQSWLKDGWKDPVGGKNFSNSRRFIKIISLYIHHHFRHKPSQSKNVKRFNAWCFVKCDNENWKSNYDLVDNLTYSILVKNYSDSNKTIMNRNRFNWLAHDAFLELVHRHRDWKFSLSPMDKYGWLHYEQNQLIPKEIKDWILNTRVNLSSLYLEDAIHEFASQMDCVAYIDHSQKSVFIKKR